MILKEIWKLTRFFFSFHRRERKSSARHGHFTARWVLLAYVAYGFAKESDSAKYDSAAEKLQVWIWQISTNCTRLRQHGSAWALLSLRFAWDKRICAWFVRPIFSVPHLPFCHHPSSARYPDFRPAYQRAVIWLSYQLSTHPTAAATAVAYRFSGIRRFCTRTRVQCFRFYLLSLISNCEHKFRINFDTEFEFAGVCVSMCVHGLLQGMPERPREKMLRDSTKNDNQMWVWTFFLSLCFIFHFLIATHTLTDNRKHRARIEIRMGACAHT